MRIGNWKLIEKATEREVELGEVIIDFRGLTGPLEDATPPRFEGSSGRVRSEGAEYYPSVYGLAWVKEEQG